MSSVSFFLDSIDLYDIIMKELYFLCPKVDVYCE